MRAIDVRNVPPEIVARVDADAKQRGISRNELLVGILSRRYGLPEPGTGTRYQGGESDQWLIRCSDQLYDVVREHARTVKGTLPGVVLLAVTAEYGLPAVSPRKRSARSLTAPQEAHVRELAASGTSQRELARQFGVTRKVIARVVHAV